jgi:transcriptional regulator with XRE-family HTH domain
VGVVHDDRVLGAWCRRQREGAGLTLRSLAKRLKISAPYLSDLEHGRRRWTPNTLAKWMAVLGDESQNEPTTTGASVAKKAGSSPLPIEKIDAAAVARLREEGLDLRRKLHDLVSYLLAKAAREESQNEPR